jgi:hypothetical protein
LFFRQGLMLTSPWLTSDCDPPTSASLVDGVVDVHHHTWSV